MELTNLFSILGVIIYFCLAVKDFRKSDWGIRKEILYSENRIKWQRKNAILELGVAIFGTLSLWTYNILKMYRIFLIFGIVTLGIFFLSLLHITAIKKQQRNATAFSYLSKISDQCLSKMQETHPFQKLYTSSTVPLKIFPNLEQYILLSSDQNFQKY